MIQLNHALLMQDLGSGADPGTRVLSSGLTGESGCLWDCTLCDGWFEILLKVSRKLMYLLSTSGVKPPTRPKGRLNFGSGRIKKTC